MSAAPTPARGLEDPDELYRHREDLPSAVRAADLWAGRAATDFEAAWKLARACYWLGTRGSAGGRRTVLERGVRAGGHATRLAPGQPEGHFWLAANMGTLAESFGIVQGLKYRGAIKAELERVSALQPGWQGGSAEAALGQWYFVVPRLFGGSPAKAEQYLRRALAYDPKSVVARSFLAEVLAADGRGAEAVALLRGVVDVPVDLEWAAEDKEYKRRAVERLKTLGRLSVP